MQSGTGTATLGRKKTGRRTQAVKIDASLAMKAGRIAEDRGIAVSDLLSEMLRERIEREWLKLVKRASEAEDGE
jgi:hypothetical protein